MPRERHKSSHCGDLEIAKTRLVDTVRLILFLHLLSNYVEEHSRVFSPPDTVLDALPPPRTSYRDNRGTDN